MKNCVIFALFVGLLLSGCTSLTVSEYGSGNLYGDALMADVPLNADAESLQTEHMLIWTGSIELEVGSLANASKQISARTKAAGGYIESTNEQAGSGRYGSGPSITLRLRVPSNKLQSFLGDLSGMGKVTSKSLSSEDVTDKYIDTEARLATKKQLRDRLQQLLKKAVDVKDIMAIEKELNRLQGDIDSMTARLKSMKGKVDYASLTVELSPIPPEVIEEVPGPLGYLWEGISWSVKKLFVWREAGVVEEAPVQVPVDNDSSEHSVIIDYIVYPGETLNDIARQYGVLVADIRTENNLGANEKIRDGQRLRIPVSE